MVLIAHRRVRTELGRALTQRLWKKKEEEEMSFLGRWVAGNAKAGASENLHEGVACNKQ